VLLEHNKDKEGSIAHAEPLPLALMDDGERENNTNTEDDGGIVLLIIIKLSPIFSLPDVEKEKSRHLTP